MKSLVILICAASIPAAASCALDEPDSGDVIDDDLTILAAVAPGPYTLVRSGSGKCVDIAGGSSADGTNIQQLSCRGGANQVFRLDAVGSDTYKLVNPASGKCVDIAGAGRNNGTNVQLWTCNGTSAQVFRVESRSGGTVRLRNPNSNRCVDVNGASNSDGANVQIWSCSSSSAQHWTLKPASGGDDDDDDDGDPPQTPKWDDAVVTAYSFQDNSACNSIMTSSGRPLVPYVSVALPFRYLEESGGGPFSLGDQIYVSFLKGRTMPNGVRHTGWVRIDDFCGDHGDDDYCFQNGEPNVDLFIGDWAQSGMSCIASNPQNPGSGSFSGPGGDGQEDTEVRYGPAPSGQFVTSYGGRAMGTGDCGDCGDGKRVQPPACWHYDPGNTNAEYCDCDNSNGRNSECN